MKVRGRSRGERNAQNPFSGDLGTASSGRSADLAVQHRLGLLPERRTRLAAADHNRCNHRKENLARTLSLPGRRAPSLPTYTVVCPRADHGTRPIRSAYFSGNNRANKIPILRAPQDFHLEAGRRCLRDKSR